MTQFVRTTRKGAQMRRLKAPALAFAAVALSAQVAFAIGGDGQPKPELRVEAERGGQNALVTMRGKNWGPAARIKVTATRAPGSAKPQDFGMISADSSGTFQVRKNAPCTTTNVDDAREQVTFTAADSATGMKATAKVDGGAWMCQ